MKEQGHEGECQDQHHGSIHGPGDHLRAEVRARGMSKNVERNLQRRQDRDYRQDIDRFAVAFGKQDDQSAEGKYDAGDACANMIVMKHEEQVLPKFRAVGGIAGVNDPERAKDASQREPDEQQATGPTFASIFRDGEIVIDAGCAEKYAERGHGFVTQQQRGGDHKHGCQIEPFEFLAEQ